MNRTGYTPGQAYASSSPSNLRRRFLLSSRSTRFPSKIVLATLALGASVALAAGCSTQTSTETAGADPVPSLNDDRSANPPASAPSHDAAAIAPAVYRGNPLCHLSPLKCMPDDDGARVTAGAVECTVKAAPDAGAGADPSLACRIARDASTGLVAPECPPGKYAGQGTDGASCDIGNDCAAGYDCVVGEKGTKSCRHYCCAGTCKGHASQNGGATFCDVQALSDVNQKAPVCMPLKRCKLLGTGECAANESCAIVTESGDTGCVAIGDRQVGASCDDDHCAAKLTCLGQPGSRKCYKLCKMTASDCESSQICATSTVFKDPTFGICQKP